MSELQNYIHKLSRCQQVLLTIIVLYGPYQSILVHTSPYYYVLCILHSRKYRRHKIAAACAPPPAPFVRKRRHCATYIRRKALYKCRSDLSLSTSSCSIVVSTSDFHPADPRSLPRRTSYFWLRIAQVQMIKFASFEVKAISCTVAVTKTRHTVILPD